MNKQIKATALFTAILLLSACSAGYNYTSENDTSYSETTVTEETEKMPETPEEFHAAMVSRSLYSLGNTARLKAKMNEAKAGEKTVIAYIGGSITEGLTAGDADCYARLSYEYFRDAYSTGDNVEYVNAGISGTPSNLGVLRLERDVLSHDADIVFVEFAVNDGQDKLAQESYESLVKTVLSQENQPAVVLLMNVIESGYTAQAHMKQIGEKYSLPIISAADALTEEFNGGRMTWDDYSDDQSHPNKDGHKLLCEFIENMYHAAESANDGEYAIPEAEMFGAPYMNVQMITPESTDSDIITLEAVPETDNCTSGGFGECWRLDAGGSMTMKAEAASFFVIFRRNKTDDMGAFDVYVNGAKLKTVDTRQADGWGEAFSQQIIKFQSAKEMDIEIRPSEGSEGKKIEILGIAAAK